MNNLKKGTKGITLVALVITIIILLILAGISISALTNQGIFEQAKNAKNLTEQKVTEENEILQNYLEQIEAIKSGQTVGNPTESEPEPTTLERAELAKPSDSTITESDATKGIVMKDKNNNEWTWIEIPKTVFTTATNDTDYNNIKSDLITYASTYRNSAYADEWYAMDGSTLVTESTEGLTETQKALNNGSGLTYNEYQETYQKMLSSVYINGGFWISRYEIGDSTATEGNTTRKWDSGITGIAVSKVNQIPYNYVTCSQAQSLASGMSTDTSKTSSLLFGIQWDLVCKYLEVNGNWDTTSNSASYYISTDSTSWGNYGNSGLTLNRGKYLAEGNDSNEWTSYNENVENYVENFQTLANKNEILTTGASEQTNKMNIYDFAGNVEEYTLENDISSTIGPCTYRGGFFGHHGNGGPASNRFGNSISNGYRNVGFRATLW